MYFSHQIWSVHYLFFNSLLVHTIKQFQFLQLVLENCITVPRKTQSYWWWLESSGIWCVGRLVPAVSKSCAAFTWGSRNVALHSPEGEVLPTYHSFELHYSSARSSQFFFSVNRFCNIWKSSLTFPDFLWTQWPWKLSYPLKLCQQQSSVSKL